MAWSYDAGLLSTSALMRVRFLIGDTNQDDPLLQDEEVEYVLTQQNNYEQLAGSECCKRIAARMSQEVPRTVGPISLDLSARIKAFSDLAKSLEKDHHKLHPGAPLYFGNSRVDKSDTDPDAIGTAARIDGMNIDGPQNPNNGYWEM